MPIDLLKEIPKITGEIGFEPTDFPALSALCKAFDQIDAG